MYQKSLLTGNIYFNGVLVPLDDSLQSYQDYVVYISNGGVVEEIESTTQEVLEIEAKNYRIGLWSEENPIAPWEWRK